MDRDAHGDYNLRVSELGVLRRGHQNGNDDESGCGCGKILFILF